MVTPAHMPYQPDASVVAIPKNRPVPPLRKSTAPAGGLGCGAHMSADDGGPTDERPLYVNAKQYHRILVRRQQRQKLEAKLRMQKGRQPYLHKSRHDHANRRKRGPGGRFLTKAESEALAAKEKRAAGGGRRRGAASSGAGSSGGRKKVSPKMATKAAVAPPKRRRRR